MAMAGQTINDRLLAARHSLAGQGLAKSVCKATTEEMIGPKKKHLDCEYPPFNFNRTLEQLSSYQLVSFCSNWRNCLRMGACGDDDDEVFVENATAESREQKATVAAKMNRCVLELSKPK